MSMAKDRDARGMGLLIPPAGRTVQHYRYWAGDTRNGQLADSSSAPMTWRPAPYFVMHPGGNGRALAVPTNDEPGSGRRGGAGADILRLALFGAKRVRWGMTAGYHAHWDNDYTRCMDFFADHATRDATANRYENKFRYERVNTQGVTTKGWQLWVDDGASGNVFVNIPGASDADGLPDGGLTGRNEGKAGYNVLEFDLDFETQEYLALRVNDSVFGDRKPGSLPLSQMLSSGGVPLGKPRPTNLSSFRWGNNFMVQPSNRIDVIPNGGPGGVYQSRVTWFFGEMYITVMSWTSEYRSWVS